MKHLVNDWYKQFGFMPSIRTLCCCVLYLKGLMLLLIVYIFFDRFILISSDPLFIYFTIADFVRDFVHYKLGNHIIHLCED